MELLIIFTTFFIAAILGLLTKRRRVIEYAAIIASAIGFIESLIIALKVSSEKIYNASAFFSVDSLGAILILIISSIGFATTIYSVKYLRCETAKDIIKVNRPRQYFVLLNLFILAMFFAITSSNPILAWISIEATTLSTAFLISFYNKPSAMEAAWKYLIINSVGLLLGFFGTLLYFTSFANTAGSYFVTWQSLMENAGQMDPFIVKVAFIFILIGYGTKVGLAPMHTWLPDAHSKAPVPISALLSGVLLNVAFFVILKFKIITDSIVGPEFVQKLFITFGTLSIFVATFIIFTQKNYKRLLAYSSIENMGLAVLGFGFGGLGVLAAILHMIYNSFTKSAFFLLSGNIFLKYSSTKIVNIRGALKTIPITAILFMTAFFTITGAPPFGIFLTKIFIFTAGINTHPVVAIIALFLTVILFIGFFKHVTAMIFGEKPEEITRDKESLWLIIPPFVLLTVVLLLSFYQPPFLQILIKNAVSIY